MALHLSGFGVNAALLQASRKAFRVLPNLSELPVLMERTAVVAGGGGLTSRVLHWSAILLADSG